MSRRRFARALACASMLSLAAVAAPASAQQIDRIVAFGDSYADTGNALRLAGINPLSTQVYTTGRFSGGSNYIDTLSNILQVPQFNFAIGGARTNNGNQNAGLPGFTFEVQQYLAGGGALGFPTVATALDESDLVAISIGGNDARAYQQGGGTLAGAPAAAATAVTSAQQNLNLLLAKGTPTISFLAGDTGKLPEIANDPAGAAVRTAYSTAFNTGIQSTLATYAAAGSTVHYLDLNQILARVTASPSAYGLQGLVCPMFPDPTCVANANAPYLIYGDFLHLTSNGFAIVARYVAAQLAAPLTLQAPSDLGLDTARQFGRTLASRSDLYGRGGMDGDMREGMRLYAIADSFSRDVEGTIDNSEFDIDGVGGTVGAEYGMEGATVGVAANYTRPRVRFGDGSARINGNSWQLGAYGSVDLGGFFGQAQVGWGRDRNRIRRSGVIDNLTARARGSHMTAGAKAGYLFPVGTISVGPILAVDHARAKVRGYTEDGDAALALNVGRQRLTATTGQAGVEARAYVGGIRPYVTLTAEHDFSGDDRVISFSQTSAPVIVNNWTVERDRETYGRLAGGVSLDLVGSLSIDAAASSTLGRDGGDEFGGQLSLRTRF